MKMLFMMLGLFIPFLTKAQIPDYSSFPVYNGSDLGLTYSPQQSSFRIWSPTADKCTDSYCIMKVLGGTASDSIDMNKSESGTWTATLKGDHKGKFYVFRVQIR